MRSVTGAIHIGNDSEKRRTGLRELWIYRELFFFFSWRDIKVRYKQTFLGAGWAILQPFLATGVFTLFFNKVAGIESDAVPYAVFAYLGLTYWNCFSSALGTVGNSLVSNTGVLTKIYFPRLIPPLSAVALSVVDFFFASIIFVPILIYFKVTPQLLGILMILPCLALVVLGALGIGIFFAALNVKYRDVRSALPFITQLMLFATPVIYPVSRIPESLQIFTYLNPVAGAVSTIRATMFGEPVPWTGFLISFLSGIVILIFSFVYFKRSEKGFVDVL
ncbi:MAG: ABC transporter permease [Candidatus Saccharimonadales bacterium]